MDCPLTLTHSWPLLERNERFDLGHILDIAGEGHTSEAYGTDALARRGIGHWSCDLRDDRLSWSPGVYDLFCLPRGAAIDREETAALYAEPSRAAMERLRAYAVKHRRGFTLDAQIEPIDGSRKWMRLIAAPVCIGERVVQLQGWKQDVTASYQ